MLNRSGQIQGDIFMHGKPGFSNLKKKDFNERNEEDEVFMQQVVDFY